MYCIVFLMEGFIYFEIIRARAFSRSEFLSKLEMCSKVLKISKISFVLCRHLLRI